jgi:hypothetical protein
MTLNDEIAAGSVRSSLAYGNTLRDQDRAMRADPLTLFKGDETWS